jgi:hypothetical protein
MVSPLRLLGALALGALVVASAGRATAVPMPYAGTLGLIVGTLPATTISGAGVAIVNGSGPGPHLTSFSLPGGSFATNGLVVPVTDPAVAPAGGIQITASNGPGAFGPLSAAGPAGGGPMPILGTAKVCLFGPCSAAIANISVPLSVVGAGGSVSVGSAIPVTVTGAPWSLGTVAVGSLTAVGFAHGPASGTSSTAAQSGVVRLVTPILVDTTLTGPLPSFGVLDLHFIPEPGTLTLIGVGLAGLVGLARRAR